MSILVYSLLLCLFSMYPRFYVHYRLIFIFFGDFLELACESHNQCIWKTCPFEIHFPQNSSSSHGGHLKKLTIKEMFHLDCSKFWTFLMRTFSPPSKKLLTAMVFSSVMSLVCPVNRGKVVIEIMST